MAENKHYIIPPPFNANQCPQESQGNPWFAIKGLPDLSLKNEGILSSHDLPRIAKLVGAEEGATSGCAWRNEHVPLILQAMRLWASTSHHTPAPTAALKDYVKAQAAEQAVNEPKKFNEQRKAFHRIPPNAKPSTE